MMGLFGTSGLVGLIVLWLAALGVWVSGAGTGWAAAVLCAAAAQTARVVWLALRFARRRAGGSRGARFRRVPR